MSSTEKTSNLKLNLWIGTDKPTRLDFVTDNQKIESAVSGHTNNTAIHLSTDDRSRLNQPFVTGYYAGDGNSTQTITLPFVAKSVIVYKKGTPSVIKNSSGELLCNTAIAIPSNGGSGCTVSGTVLTVQQSTSAVDGALYNMNASGGQYAYIAYK